MDRSAGRSSAAIAKPPGRFSRTAEKRDQTASSSGRSTWQETTAYRSRLTVRRLYRHAYLVIALAAALPRLMALLYERDDILAAFTDKSDDFALTFLDSGTYGFIPGVPSAYTQPLYGFFLIPIYWIAERHWLAVGLVQITVAIGTAWLVYAIGLRVATKRMALLAALLSTLHPYLVWHDVHVNREILDQALAAALVLFALIAAERGRSLWWAAALGSVLGLAILGNARLLFLPIVLGVWLFVRLGLAHHGLAGLLVVGVSAALVLSPWVVRNRVSVGCFAVTTDARALWKANNLNTYDVLDRGGWIDDVPSIPGAPPSPQNAGAIYERTGRIVEVDECGQMRFYRELVLEFWREHPGEKGRLAAQAARLLWQPNVLETQGRPGAGTWQDKARSTVEPVFMIALFGLAIIGLFVLPRSFVALALLLLGYQTIIAMLFAGATRYRVPWDFLIALMAAAGIDAIADRVARRRYDSGVLRRAPL